MFNDVQKVLSAIKPDDIVLDVGGWACPFNRANYIIDSCPYETRGFYEKIGMPKSQGGEKEFFSKETWVERDFCDKKPWPFEDKFFDFSICSHTLEDIRDPLYVYSELIRVSKRGYIEVPSRLIESCRGIESDSIVGLSHHRWLVDISDNHIQFTMKYHIIHGDILLSFPPKFAKTLDIDKTISYLFWENDFSFAETRLDGVENIYQELYNFVKSNYDIPTSVLVIDRMNKLTKRIAKGVKRRLTF